MNHPVLLCRFCRRRLLHLRLDEELQNVVVLLALLHVATERRVGTAGLGAQHQGAVVEAPLRGLVHDVEPGPRLQRAACAVRALVLLLQVLNVGTEAAFSKWADAGLQPCAESRLALYLVRRLSHFLAICSELSLPWRPRPFKMVLTNTHR